MYKTFRLLHLFYLWLLLLLLLTACDSAKPPGPSATPSPTPTLPPLAQAVDVEQNAIVVAIPIDPPSFNAYLNDTGYEMLAGELVYGALAEIGPDGNYYPELAADLPTLANGGLSEDGLTVTWHLRPDVLWSDDQPFTADDVRFTWESLRDSGIWAPGFDLIEDIETPDPYTAIIHYSEFYPNYLIQFGGRGTGVFPAHYCGPTNQMLFWDCNLEPISTGPFVLGQWIPGVRLTFTANPNYYLPDRPLAEQLVLSIQPDPDFRRRNLERGNVHLDLWPEDPILRQMEDSGNINVVRSNPSRFVLRLVPNLSDPNGPGPQKAHPVLGNVRLRQAIRQAIDPGLINNEAFNGRGTVVDTELFQFDCDIAPYDFNPGLAAALFDEAGWILPEGESVRRCQGCGTVEDGTPLMLQSYSYVELGSQLDTAHRLIEGMLAEIGIQLERHTVEGSKLWGTWEDNGIELRGNFDLDLWDDGYFSLDPTTYLTDYFDPRSIPTRDNPVAGLNISRYQNPGLIKVFDALHTPLPNNRRRALLCEIAIALHQDLPQIPLVALPDYYATHVNLQGVVPNIYDTITWNAEEWQLLSDKIEQ